MISSSTAESMLYLPSSWRSCAHVGSAGYGRYSATSRAQRSALEMPAASKAAWSGSTVALLALTLVVAGADSDGVLEATLDSDGVDVGVGLADVLVADDGVDAAPAPAHAARPIARTRPMLARLNFRDMTYLCVASFEDVII